MCVVMNMPLYTCRGQMTTGGSWFSPSVISVPGTKLKVSDLVASDITR